VGWEGHMRMRQEIDVVKLLPPRKSAGCRKLALRSLRIVGVQGLIDLAYLCREFFNSLHFAISVLIRNGKKSIDIDATEKKKLLW
jgi:hypothetical protein